MSYKKVGGIHFVKLWRFGFNFYVSRSNKARVERAADLAFARLAPALGVKSRVENGRRIFN